MLSAPSENVCNLIFAYSAVVINKTQHRLLQFCENTVNASDMVPYKMNDLG